MGSQGRFACFQRDRAVVRRRVGDARSAPGAVSASLPWGVRTIAVMARRTVTVTARCRVCGPVERAEERTRARVFTGATRPTLHCLTCGGRLRREK